MKTQRNVKDYFSLSVKTCREGTEGEARQVPTQPHLRSSRPCSLGTQRATPVSSHNFSPPLLLVNCFLLHDCQGRRRRGLTLDAATPLVLPPPAATHTPLSIKQLLTLITFLSLLDAVSQKGVFFKITPQGSPPQEGPTPTESTISGWE